MKRDEIQSMVERVSWMSPIDYEILSFFEDHDIVASPKVIALNIEYDRQYTSKRCRALESEEILTSSETGVYSLSERGRKFLLGEIDPEEFEKDDLEDTQ